MISDCPTIPFVIKEIYHEPGSHIKQTLVLSKGRASGEKIKGIQSSHLVLGLLTDGIMEEVAARRSRPQIPASDTVFQTLTAAFSHIQPRNFPSYS